MKTLAGLLLLVPSIALAGEVDMKAEVRFRYTTDEFGQEYAFRPSVGFRYDTVFGSDEHVAYVVPALFFRRGNWQGGPELRLPVFGRAIEKYRLMFKLELKLSK